MRPRILHTVWEGDRVALGESGIAHVDIIVPKFSAYGGIERKLARCLGQSGASDECT
jgi:hypothetical protein